MVDLCNKIFPGVDLFHARTLLIQIGFDRRHQFFESGIIPNRIPAWIMQKQIIIAPADVRRLPKQIEGEKIEEAETW